MSDFTEVTRQGLFSRGKNSIGGAIFGCLLVAVGCVLLFWNEGRSVKRYQDLKEGAAAVVSSDSSRVDAANEGALVHLTGDLKTSGVLEDKDFGVSLDAIKLTRTVEMFQWVENIQTEEETKVGGSVETTRTYSYATEWRPGPVDSSKFKVQEGHRNPKEFPFRAAGFRAKGVTLGAFAFPDFFLERMGGSEPLKVESLQAASPTVRNGAQLHQGGIYFGNNPASPQVGDLKVQFSAVMPGPVSVIAQQKGATLISYQAKSGGQVDLIEPGTVPAEEMFSLARERNKFMTWVIRIGGFILLGISFSMIFKPLSILADVIPFVGRIVGAGTTFIAFVLAGILWAITVSFAWIFYRPLIGIVVGLIAVGLIVLAVNRLRKVSASTPMSVPSDGPPPLN